MACAHLQAAGVVVLERNLRVGRGELDLVGRLGSLLLFVEVKSRRANDLHFGSALEALSVAKQRQVRRLAELLLVQRGWWGCPCRFDLVAVTFGPGEPQVEWLQDAF